MASPAEPGLACADCAARSETAIRVSCRGGDCGDCDCFELHAGVPPSPPLFWKQHLDRSRFTGTGLPFLEELVALNKTPPISILLNWGYLLCQTCAVAMSFTHTDLQGLFTIPALDSFPGTERNGRARERRR